MNPAECFQALWELTQRELAKASGRPHLVQGTVLYRLTARGLDGGRYSWNRGAPSIHIFRDRDLPKEQNRPDLQTRPIEDACTLSHEYGHFLSDRDGGRTQAAYDRLGKFAPLTDEQKQLILDEERSAWNHGRELLESLGCTEWAEFEAMRERLVMATRRDFVAAQWQFPSLLAALTERGSEQRSPPGCRR